MRSMSSDLVIVPLSHGRLLDEASRARHGPAASRGTGRAPVRLCGPQGRYGRSRIFAKAAVTRWWTKPGGRGMPIPVRWIVPHASPNGGLNLHRVGISSTSDLILRSCASTGAGAWSCVSTRRGVAEACTMNASGPHRRPGEQVPGVGSEADMYPYRQSVMDGVAREWEVQPDAHAKILRLRDERALAGCRHLLVDQVVGRASRGRVRSSSSRYGACVRIGPARQARCRIGWPCQVRRHPSAEYRHRCAGSRSGRADIACPSHRGQSRRRSATRPAPALPRERVEWGFGAQGGSAVFGASRVHQDRQSVSPEGSPCRA